MSKTLEQQLHEAQIEMEELKYKLAQSELDKLTYKSICSKNNEEFEQLHMLINALPGSITRRGEEWFQQRSVSTRLAAWLGSTRSKE